ncbi:MAG: hypothetical protein Q4F71_05430 [Paracoccus sp. (in: a-proteobacteria)]|nr:hypothetical protein [Paracoccus sp. (in: a-proteobacteria)]
MNAPSRQSDCLGRLGRAPGPDALALLRFDGGEYPNNLFEYRIEALATRSDIVFDALIGTPAAVEIAGNQKQEIDGSMISDRLAGFIGARVPETAGSARPCGLLWLDGPGQPAAPALDEIRERV